MAGDHVRLRRGQPFQEEQDPAPNSCRFGRHHGGRSRYIRATASRRAIRTAIGAPRDDGRPSHGGYRHQAYFPGSSPTSTPLPLESR
jgi:hypothetical protein